MKRFGYADLVGLVAALAAIAVVPGFSDPLTYTKLFVLAAGGLALLPAAIWRWKSQGKTPWYVWLVAGSAAALVVWGVISMFGSGAPIANSLFGWWGRGDGLFALAGAVSIFLGAATLKSREWARTVTWLLAGATVASLVGLLQAGGIAVVGTTDVMSLMGNTNFAAGYFAMMFPLAVGRAVMPAALWQRVWAGALAVIMAVLAWLTDAIQGPAALAAGLVAFWVIFTLAYRGRLRVPALISSAAIVVVGAALLVMSFVGVGPLTRLWSERTFEIRQQYWQSGWNILNALPVFGTGPDGFARYVAEYRPESYVELLGPVLRVSAAHNIPLQIGATMGWLAMILWIIAMAGTMVLLIFRAVRAPVLQVAATASVGGALAAYLVQGLVSIDMLPILATGWVVAGIALAAAREPVPGSSSSDKGRSETSAQSSKSAPRTSSQARKARAAEAFRPDEGSAPAWVPVTAGVLGLVAAIAVGAQMTAVNNLPNLQTQEDAVTALTSSLTPCPPRVEIAQGVVQQIASDVAVPALFDATALDPRCSGMLVLESQVLTQQGDLERADASTAFLTEIDPLFAEAWVLRGLYQVAAGDLEGANTSLAEAERVNALYPDPQAGQERIANLRDAIAQGSTG